jgi:hypothetical protein
MSETSTLNFEYEAAAGFAERVNDDVLLVKRWAIGRSPDNVTRFERACRELAQLFETLAARLSARKAPPPPMAVPPEVVERLASRHTDNLSCFTQDLAEAAGALRSGHALSPAAIAVLDEVSETADAMASTWFRRLRRR